MFDDQTFNRTAYGIETCPIRLYNALLHTFNRTAYGIETQTVTLKQGSHVFF